MYQNEDTGESTNLDQLPSSWAVSDEMLEEMARDLDDIHRNEAAVTEAELELMYLDELAKGGQMLLPTTGGAFCFSPTELAIIEDSRLRRTA